MPLVAWRWEMARCDRCTARGGGGGGGGGATVAVAGRGGHMGVYGGGHIGGAAVWGVVWVAGKSAAVLAVASVVLISAARSRGPHRWDPRRDIRGLQPPISAGGGSGRLRLLALRTISDDAYAYGDCYQTRRYHTRTGCIRIQVYVCD